MYVAGKHRSASRPIDNDFESVEIGAVFGKITLKEKTGSLWIMVCACGREKKIKRSDVVRRFRSTCGECGIRKQPERVKKEDLRKICADFEVVEVRKMPYGDTWNFYRERAKVMSEVIR